MNTTATFSLIDGKLTNMDTQKSISLQKTGDKSFIGIMLPAEELINKMSLTIMQTVVSISTQCLKAAR